MIEITTLCYVDDGERYLMLHRTKKEQDINKDKYIGIGGHVEIGESPEECIRREAFEETGLTLNTISLRGIITFVMDDIQEITFLYTCDSFTGDITDCSEGDLCWVNKSEICNLPLWEGDKIFFNLLNERLDVFSLKLNYESGKLTDCSIE